MKAGLILEGGAMRGLFGYIPFGIECLVITDAWMRRRERKWREEVEK